MVRWKLSCHSKYQLPFPQHMASRARLERKFLFGLAHGVFLSEHEWLCSFVHCKSGDDDRLMGSDGADEFTAAAADAEIGIHFGNGESVFPWHHVNRLGGAVFGTRTAGRAFGFYHTTPREKFSHTRADESALFHRDWADRSGGADL